MNPDAAKYLELFAHEAREHLEALAQDLVALEKPDKREEAVASVFRHAHSVKGMAASMGFEPIAALSHKLEDVADVLRRGQGQVPRPETLDLLLSASDRLREMVEAGVAGRPILEDPGLMEALTGAATPSFPSPIERSVKMTPGDISGAAVELGANEHRYRVTVRIGGGSAAPAARAFLVHRKVGAFGPVVAASPSLEEIRAGKLADGSTLSITLHTPSDALAVKKAVLSVAEVAEVEIAEEAPARDAAPAAAKAPAPAAAAAADEGAKTVRVKTELLDYLIDAGGELLIATARLRELVRALPPSERPALSEGLNALQTIVKELHGRVLTIRMTPLSFLTSRIPRTVRDTARKSGKDVEVEITGADIAIDRAILDALEGAFQHVLRNSVDHGIELPEARLEAGKPARGKITVSAQREKNRVLLRIEDDGVGMDASRLRESAVARGLMTRAAATALSDREAWMLSLLPGLSTREEVTDLSGRGVGMDAVKTAVEALGGSLEIESTPGKGTAILFHLPLTVAVLHTLLASVGGEIYGLPMSIVVGAVERPQADAEKGSTLVGDGPVPAYALARLLEVPADPSSGPRPFVIVESARGRTALMVDKLLGQEEAVLKPVSRPLERIRGISGVTILGSGRPVFILDVPRLVAA